MIGIQQHPIFAQGVFRGVREAMAAVRQAAGAQHRRMGDRAQREDDADARLLCEFRAQKFVARLDFQRQRLVGRRQAFHRVGDTRVEEPQFVIGGGRYGAARETILMQRLVEQYPGMIAGKRPTGAIGPVLARRQADDEQARVWVAERGNRPAEVVGFFEPTASRNAARRGQRLHPGSNVLFMRQLVATSHRMQ